MSMLISFVVPAFNAAKTILGSVLSVTSRAAELPPGWAVEVIVVDDGGKDGAQLLEVVKDLPGVKVVQHATNRGICAARNSGLCASGGDVAIILDADDEMTATWPADLVSIMAEWPERSNLCFALCRNTSGRITVSRPEYSGLASFDDMLLERFPGEYVPLFRGPYVRQKLYADLGTRKSCGLLSYLAFAADAPIWITNRVLRIYRDRQPGSVTRDWANPGKAAETAKCYDAVMARFGPDYARVAPGQYRSRMLRLAVYRSFARLPGPWAAWRQGMGLSTFLPALAAGGLIVFGPAVATRLVAFAKRVGLIRAYG